MVNCPHLDEAGPFFANNYVACYGQSDKTAEKILTNHAGE
jgi:hypothetical protein